MSKNKNLIKNTSYNFKLRKRPSLFIGTYILLSTLLIKLTLSEFITDSSPFGFLTVNYLEYFILLVALLTFIFSLLALFFGNRKHQRKIGFKLWNRNSKKSMLLLFCLIIILYFIEFYLLRIGEEAFIIPTFIIYHGFIIIILNFSRIISLYKVAMISILIGFIPLFINQFDFYALILLSISHYVFAFTNNNLE